MFQNPDTLLIEIIAVVLISAFISIVIGVFIYKKIHHLPTGECAECCKGTKKLLKEYHKLYPKDN